MTDISIIFKILFESASKCKSIFSALEKISFCKVAVFKLKHLMRKYKTLTLTLIVNVKANVKVFNLKS